MLKKLTFTPAHPMRAETRIFPGVLGSKKSSTYPTPGQSCLGSSGWVGENRYACDFFSPAALLDQLFEHPIGESQDPL
jgi:hypothetical protein